jgi:hypothetical protein
MTPARNWVGKVRSRADLLPHGDVGTPERMQSEVAFAEPHGRTAARRNRPPTGKKAPRAALGRRYL